MLKLNLNLNKLKEDIEKSQKKTFEKDTRFWKPKKDDKGNATILLRFLPDNDGECWAKILKHNFKYIDDSSTKFYIKNCINTFGYDQECPLCKKVAELYRSSFDSDKKLGAERRSKTTFISNVLIIQDKNEPENEGQIKLFEYGVKIFDKIKSRIMPSDIDLQDPDFVEFNPFHPLQGATFKLIVTQNGEFPNYDKSNFSIQKPLYDGNENKINEILEKCYPLSEFLNRDLFPTNDEVIQKLGPILGITQKPKSKPIQKPQEVEEVEETSISNNMNYDIDDLDDDLKYFDSIK